MKLTNRCIFGSSLAAIAGISMLVGCARDGQTETTNKTTGTATTTKAPAAMQDGHEHTHGGAGHENAAGHTHTTKLIFSTEPKQLTAGQKATLELKIVDDIDNTPITAFDKVHDKLLHLILVSQDLSWFSHIHPEHADNGVFRISTTLPRAGKYKLYADYRPTEREGEVAQQAFEVGGANPLPAASKLVPDKLSGGWMVKNAGSGIEGEPDKVGAPYYQVALMPMPQKLVAGKDVMLHFQVRDANGKPLPSLQPYLGAQGHLVLLSADSNTYLHTHPLLGGGEHTMDGVKMESSGGGSDVMFHTNFPQAGLYKGWGQFQYNDKLITAPFVLKVEAAAATSGASEATAAKNKVSVTIDEGYSPAVLNVKAGEPLAITFTRKERYGCGNVVQFPALGIKRSLKTGESTTVTITPKSGTLNFTCGMNMYKGKIVAK